MSFDLCQVKQAKNPYYIESISTSIYSIEELCFYLYENIYLIDSSIVNEKLCDWIRDELGLKKLYRQMYDQLEKQESIGNFILPIFREIGYLSLEEFRGLQEKISRLEVQPEDARQKLKGDYLVKCGMYSNAMHEYYQILGRKGPGNLGAQFYAEIWNNLGCAYAGLFLFKEASVCYFKAWEQVRTKEMLRKYVSALPLYLSEEEYKKKLQELGADKYLISKIQEYNSKVCEHASAKNELEGMDMEKLSVYVEELRENYRRGTKC
ncbi:MAG: hypothetical protein PHE06_14835 [Lachnospiraceae bacterium]|nr:hypothetical protein [Lachnospiraceae bacterium]MDD3797210.1 hypothetical protein [Lachnospiraceae bacterium]